MSRIKAWLVAAIAAVTATLTAFMAGRATGKAEQKTKEVRRRVLVLQEARKVQDEVAHLSDDDLRSRLNEWMRKD